MMLWDLCTVQRCVGTFGHRSAASAEGSATLKGNNMKSFQPTLRRTIDRVVRGSMFRALSERDGPATSALIGFLHREHIYQRLDRLEAMLASAGSDHVHAPALGERVRNLLSLISPMDPVGHHLRRFGRDHDGGYILLGDLLAVDGIAYSFGISDDVSWDYDLAECGYEVFQYDHTIESLPREHSNFHFHKLGLCASGREAPPMRSIDQIIDNNGHAGKRNMILKIDIEGDEWEVLSTIPSDRLRQFDQIVVEYHWLDRTYEDSFYATARRALANIGNLFVPIHVHGNNHYDIKVLGGVAVPQLIEVSYVRKGLVEMEPCRRTFPTELDQPNKADWPDLYLGSFRF